MNPRHMLATMALATLAKPGGYACSRDEWAALVKAKRYDDALQAEVRSFPAKPGVYVRHYYQLWSGMSVIKEQTVVVAESQGKFFIVLKPEDGKEAVRLLPIASVGGFFEFIREATAEAGE